MQFDMGDVLLNLLSDKIAITYGSLNGKPRCDAAWNRYTTVNDFAFIDDEKLLCISIAPNLFINCMTMVFLDPETGEELEELPYMDITEEEFFQYTTIYDFGACDFDDITFTKKHICALQGMTDNFLKKVTEQIAKLKEDLHEKLAREIANEIDKDFIQQLSGIVLNPKEVVLPNPPTPTKIASMPLLADALKIQMMGDSCVSFKAMNQGNP